MARLYLQKQKYTIFYIEIHLVAAVFIFTRKNTCSNVSMPISKPCCPPPFTSILKILTQEMFRCPLNYSFSVGLLSLILGVQMSRICVM